MSRIKSLAACLLIVLAGAMAYAGGARQTTLPAASEDYEFTWYVHYDWATYMADWGGEIADYVFEQTGTRARWIMSGGAAQQKLSTMIVSNDLPDVITMDRGSELDSLVGARVLVPLDDYFEQYPNFQVWGGRRLVNLLRSRVDDNWYGMPSWYTNENYPLGNSGWIVNSKYYNALGRPPLDTIDDLYAYLTKVRRQFPDVYPISISNALRVLYSVFGHERVPTLVEPGLWRDGDTLRSILDDPAFLEAILFANRLYREGLLNGDEFAMRTEQLNERFNTGRIAVGAVADALNGSRTRHQAFREIDPEGGYEVIHPPIKAGLDRDRVYNAQYDLIGWNVATITRAAENPERIYAFLDWLTGQDGQAASLYGPPGRFWDSWTTYQGVQVPDLTVPLYTQRDLQAFKDVVGAWNFNWVPNAGWQYVESKYRTETDPPPTGEWQNIGYATISRAYAVATDQYANIAPDPASELGIRYTSMQEIYNRQTLMAILASSEREARAAISSARDQLNRLGLDAVLTEFNQNWTARVELMNRP